MLARKYIERKIEKRSFWNPTNGTIYIEGQGLATTQPDTLARAVAFSLAHSCELLYIMPARGRWNDKRGQYPGKLDWQRVAGLQLKNYFRNHAATVAFQKEEEKELDIVPIGCWFPSFAEDMYMSNAILAMHYLQGLLTKYFQPIEVIKGKHDVYRVELLSTPARTGMDLLRRKLPYGVKYPDLPADVERIVMENFGQSRTELFDHGRDTVDNLYNYDGLWMYASCCRHMPVGEVIHDHVDKYEKYVTGLYRVTARVPDDWAHIGLLPVRKDDKTVWPNTPGMTLESWCGHRDIPLALEHGWSIKIEERILWPQTQARGVKGQDPLRHFMETLVTLREDISKQYNEPVRTFLRDGFRSILNHSIGRLHSAGRKVDIYTQNYKEYPGDDAILREEFDDGSFRYEKREEMTPHQKETFKPHWAVEVWNQAKHKLTKAALTVPYDQLLALRTDGIWTTCECQFENTGKPGCFREKELKQKGPFDWPRGAFSDVELLDMMRKARNG